jgi:hypothetical protein
VVRANSSANGRLVQVPSVKETIRDLATCEKRGNTSWLLLEVLPLFITISFITHTPDPPGIPNPPSPVASSHLRQFPAIEFGDSKRMRAQLAPFKSISYLSIRHRMLETSTVHRRFQVRCNHFVLLDSVIVIKLHLHNPTIGNMVRIQEFSIILHVVLSQM